jgi:hypothetical protein
LDRNQELDKLGLEFNEILRNCAEVRSLVTVADIYIPLLLLLKKIDVSEPNRS